MTSESDKPIEITFELESGTIALAAGEQFQSNRNHAVDLCFVFDTTGSMNDKIDGLVSCMVDFVRELAGLSLDWRVSVVPFGDLTVPRDRIVGDLPFVAERAHAESQLRQMPRNSGGGNDGESSIEAMYAALKKPYRSDAVKILVLLTDEPALGAARAQALEAELRRDEFITFVVSPNLVYYRSWAETTGGGWFPISSAVDTSAILSLLRELAARLALVAHEVHALAGGSVSKYLALGHGAD